MKAQGKAHTYGDNIDTDVIIPARYLNTSEASELAAHCMEDVDAAFAARVQSGDILVGGRNFGCGSSREHAPLAIKASGVACVIAESFARIFYRNALNIALPILECPAAARAISAGDEVSVDLETGEIVDKTTGQTFAAEPFPPFMLELIAAGGLAAYMSTCAPGASHAGPAGGSGVSPLHEGTPGASHVGPGGGSGAGSGGGSGVPPLHHGRLLSPRQGPVARRSGETPLPPGEPQQRVRSGETPLPQGEPQQRVRSGETPLPPGEPQQRVRSGETPLPQGEPHLARLSGASGAGAAKVVLSRKVPPPPSFFSRFASTDCTRANLPHWEQQGVTCFATFRLADALPQEKIVEWAGAQANWLASHPRPWTDAEAEEYARDFGEKFEQALDAGWGACLLATEENRMIVEDAFRHFDGERYDLYAYVVMPNHVHVLFSPRGAFAIHDILHAWKSFTGHAINRRMNRTGAVWQKESWDRLIRNDEHFRRTLAYIKQNNPTHSWSAYEE